jgi:hypothetical protein
MERRMRRRDRPAVDMVGTEPPESPFLRIFFEIFVALGCC